MYKYTSMAEILKDAFLIYQASLASSGETSAFGPPIITRESSSDSTDDGFEYMQFETRAPDREKSSKSGSSESGDSESAESESGESDTRTLTHARTAVSESGDSAAVDRGWVPASLGASETVQSPERDWSEAPASPERDGSEAPASPERDGLEAHASPERDGSEAYASPERVGSEAYASPKGDASPERDGLEAHASPERDGSEASPERANEGTADGVHDVDSVVLAYTPQGLNLEVVEDLVVPQTSVAAAPAEVGKVLEAENIVGKFRNSGSGSENSAILEVDDASLLVRLVRRGWLKHCAVLLKPSGASAEEAARAHTKWIALQEKNADVLFAEVTSPRSHFAARYYRDELSIPLNVSYADHFFAHRDLRRLYVLRDVQMRHDMGAGNAAILLCVSTPESSRFWKTWSGCVASTHYWCALDASARVQAREIFDKELPLGDCVLVVTPTGSVLVQNVSEDIDELCRYVH